MKKLITAFSVILILLPPAVMHAGLSVGDQAVDFNLLSHFNTYYHLYDDLGKVILINFATLW